MTTAHQEFNGTSASQARHRVCDAIHGCDAAVASVELLVSELVTNALIHAGQVDVGLVVDQTDRCVHVGVSDSSAADPLPRASGGDLPGGYGLQLVQALASDWGVVHHPNDGKTVWFEVECDGRHSSG